MRRSILTGILLALLPGGPLQADPPKSPAAVRLAADDLAFLAGKWIGTLEYLDYSDNKTRTRLATTLDARLVDGLVRYKFSYTEPKGKKVEGEETTVRLAGEGTRVRFNEDEWTVAGRAIDAKAGTYEVTLGRDGTDGKAPAKFRRVLSLSKKTLTIRTEVKTETADEPIVRNEYTLTKE